MCVNKKFADDYFFNRIYYNNYHRIERKIRKTNEVLEGKNINAYIYVKNRASLKNLLKKYGFSYIDTIYTLRSPKKIKLDGITKRNTIVIKKNKDILLWCDVFCKSFDITVNKNSIVDIIIKNKRKYTFLITIVTINENEKLPVGCGLLFERENCLSLYCLGTIPDYRNEGIARNTLIKALEIAYKKKYQSIFLQTFQKDEYIGMYKKMKFTIVNKREVFSNKEI